MAFRGVDYMLFDSLLSEEEKLVLQTARRFADERVLPLVRNAWRDGIFPSELIPELGETGFLGATLEGYGSQDVADWAATQPFASGVEVVHPSRRSKYAAFMALYQAAALYPALSPLPQQAHQMSPPPAAVAQAHHHSALAST